MADIAFLLLIYFMIASTFTATRGLDFGLAEDTEPAPIDPVEAVLVEVQPDRGLRVDQWPMELDQLLPYLAPKLARNPDKPVLVRTAPTAPYGAMVSVLDELRQGRERLGLEREVVISIPTEREVGLFWQAFWAVNRNPWASNPRTKPKRGLHRSESGERAGAAELPPVERVFLGSKPPDGGFTRGGLGRFGRSGSRCEQHTRRDVLPPTPGTPPGSPPRRRPWLNRFRDERDSRGVERMSAFQLGHLVLCRGDHSRPRSY